MSGFNIVFIVIFGIAILFFVLTVVFIFSSSFREKMLSKQIKISKNVVKNSMDDLKELNSFRTDIDRDYYRNIASGIKEGLKDLVYCKHCGKEIDNDSTFCKYCGKEQ